VEMEGLENLEQARATGRGIVLITGHFTPMEVAARILGETTPSRMMYRKNNNPVFEWVSSRYRSRHIVELIPHKQVKHFLDCLRQGELAVYLTDQDYRLRHSVFAPFFGIQTATIRKLSEYAKDTNALILPVEYGRKSNGEGYHFRFLPALDNFPSGDDVADATQLNQLIENNIVRFPEQYLWQHRRFKNRPEGEASFY